MKREQIIDFLQQAQTMANQLGEMSNKLNQGRAIKDILQAQGEVERVVKMGRDLQAGEEAFEKSAKALTRKCKRDTIADSETVIQDIVERIKLADTAFEQWRQLLAAHELQIALGADSQEERAAREAALSEAQKRYETALELASQTVPPLGVVLL